MPIGVSCKTGYVIHPFVAVGRQCRITAGFVRRDRPLASESITVSKV